GDYVAFLDHDDVFAADFLFEVVTLLNQKPGTDICYFDEDLLSEDGRQRHSPFFKPDWSAETLRGVNYLTHAVVRRKLVEEIGPFDPACDGAQDWDFVFRCTERTSAIEHIPKILY